MTKNTQQTYELSNNPAGSSSKKGADKSIKALVDKYNERNPGMGIDLSLNALIMIIIRLHDSIRTDPTFKGGYNEMARVIRRHLFNRLNLCILYKEDQTNEQETDEE